MGREGKWEERIAGLVLRSRLIILSMGLSLFTLTEEFSNAFRARICCALLACLLPLAPAGKTEMLSADQTQSVMFLSSLPNNLPLETSLLVSAFQFFGNKENNKGEDELRFFYIFTKNDHGRETFLSQWLSCGVLHFLCTSNQHNQTLSPLSWGPLQILVQCLFLQR